MVNLLGLHLAIAGDSLPSPKSGLTVLFGILLLVGSGLIFKSKLSFYLALIGSPVLLFSAFSGVGPLVQFIKSNEDGFSWPVVFYVFYVLFYFHFCIGIIILLLSDRPRSWNA